MTDNLGPGHFTVDLDNCADEPIHIPGSIQPHGALLAMTPDDLVVRVASANSQRWIGAAPTAVIGRPLSEFLGDEVTAWVRTVHDGPQHRDGIVVAGLNGEVLDATAHQSGAYVIVEVEPRGTVDPEVAQFSRRATLALQADNEVEVAERAATIVRMLTGFDRVMVYRFDQHWNGEVIAERCRRDLNRFLGLHYPASDIPAQARALYERNWIRAIVDIGYEPVPLLPAVSHADDEPLDLSGAALRSVSPIHIEYLTNMGVTASMSVSLMVNGRLWGLIACHHYSGPLHPSAAIRTAAEFLGQVASTTLSQHVALANNELDFQLTTIVDRVAEALNTSTVSVRETILAHGDEVLAIAGASSAAVVEGAELWAIGQAPPMEVLDAVRKHAASSSMPWFTDRLADTLGQTPRERDGRWAGALACQLSPGWEDLIVWFREEQVREVDWGGDPQNAKLYANEGDRVRLSPRKSFDRWRETVRDTSRPWLPAVVRNAGRGAFKLAGALLREERAGRALTDQLQAMIRPSGGAEVDGYDLDMWYQPADNGQVGGDWFDVVLLADGATAVIVGDVTGHGVQAAAEMTQLRHMLRAYFLIERSPARALAMLDRAVAASIPGTLATCVCAVLDGNSGRAVISSAGHVPAVVVRRGQRAEFVEAGADPLLGLETGERHEVGLDLEEGDLLVLYSDGLVERRTQLVDVGLRSLADLATSLAGEADLHAVTEGLLGIHGGSREDDVCVVAVRRC